jgi:parallel beta-helix repeat protein
MQTHSAVVRGLTVRSRVSQTSAFHAVNISQGRLLMEDCEIRSGSRACVSVYGSTTDPLLRNCVIRGALTSGIIVFAGAKGTIEDCDISENAYAGVEVTQGARPVVRRCKIRNNKGRGLVISGKGQSTVTDCEISDNALAGIEVSRDGSASIRQCRINRNFAAVWMLPGSTAAVERCDLTDNKQGPWKIERAVSLYRSGNRV